MRAPSGDGLGARGQRSRKWVRECATGPDRPGERAQKKGRAFARPLYRFCRSSYGLTGFELLLLVAAITPPATASSARPPTTSPEELPPPAPPSSVPSRPPA